LELNCTFLECGDILIARMPNPIGRACIFPLIEMNRYITAVDICIVRHKSDLSSEFLIMTMNSPLCREAIMSMVKGATRQRISSGNLKSILFPMPPVNEQRRITANVNELIAICNELKSARTLPITPVQQNIIPFMQKVTQSDDDMEIGLAARGDASQPFSEKLQKAIDDWDDEDE